MSYVIGADLGATKLSLAMFDTAGGIAEQRFHPLEGRSGKLAGSFVTHAIADLIAACRDRGISPLAVCICIPGIARKDGTVWAPNIEGWEAYPLLEELRSVTGDMPVGIESDRTCYIQGERWMGKAKGLSDAIFIAVGTGIGAGICAGGRVLEGNAGIAGAIGWMTMNGKFIEPYERHGYLEYHASGSGIARLAAKMAAEEQWHHSILAAVHSGSPKTADVFDAYHRSDPLATAIIGNCIKQWGMAVANLVTIFNPQMVVFGGGVFGPAVSLLPLIGREAARWAQPLAFAQVRIEASQLGPDAGIFGAGSCAWKFYHQSQPSVT